MDPDQDKFKYENLPEKKAELLQPECLRCVLGEESFLASNGEEASVKMV